MLPRYLTGTERVLAGMSKSEMQKREAADRAAGTLNFAPRTDDAAWGANFSGSPIASDSASYDETTIFFVVVPNWSDGTPAPLHK